MTASNIQKEFQERIEDTLNVLRWLKKQRELPSSGNQSSPVRQPSRSKKRRKQAKVLEAPDDDTPRPVVGGNLVPLRRTNGA